MFGCSAKMVVVTPQISLHEQPEIISCDSFLQVINNSVVFDSEGNAIESNITLSMFLNYSECKRDETEAWEDDSTILRRLIERHNARENN